MNTVSRMCGNKWMGMYLIKNASKEKDSYTFASRKKRGSQCIDGNYDADAVEIIAFHKDYVKPRKVVVIENKYRPAVGCPVWEFPAGIIEKGEDIVPSAIREFKEETGLDLFKVNVVSSCSFKSAGIIDESSALVTGLCSGKPSKDFLEKYEDIDVHLMTDVELNKLASSGAKLTMSLTSFIASMNWFKH